MNFSNLDIESETLDFAFKTVNNISNLFFDTFCRSTIRRRSSDFPPNPFLRNSLNFYRRHALSREWESCPRARSTRDPALLRDIHTIRVLGTGPTRGARGGGGGAARGSERARAARQLGASETSGRTCESGFAFVREVAIASSVGAHIGSHTYKIFMYIYICPSRL